MEEKAKTLDLSNVAPEEDHHEKEKLAKGADAVDGNPNGEYDFGADPVDELNKKLEDQANANFKSP